ncbi:MAG: hypothetical protein M0R66_01260 [Candidatus Omnitrophica bacterium]|nr:hypothetical protein [Candidatus Omnitrophota bacterium]
MDFDSCVAANKDKDDPNAYCATIMRNVEGKAKSGEGVNRVDVTGKSPAEIERQTAALEGEWFLENEADQRVFLVRRKTRRSIVSRARVAKAWETVKTKANPDEATQAWLREVEKEQREHPWLSRAQAERVVEDHHRTENEGKARVVGGYESPEPGNLPEKKKRQLAAVYAKLRKQGFSKERAAKQQAWGAVRKNVEKAGVAQIPASLTKQVQGAPTPAKPKETLADKARALWKRFRKSQFDGNPRYQARKKVLEDCARKELESILKRHHPDYNFTGATRSMLVQHILDAEFGMGDRKAVSESTAHHEKEVLHGKLPLASRVARHSAPGIDSMREYAELEASFLKPGVWSTDGVSHPYEWDTILRDMKTFNGREFYISHNTEENGFEYGIIADTEARVIDGENWAVAKIRVPETDFTQDLLARIENGLIRFVSSTHRFRFNPEDPSRRVLSLAGKAITTVREPEVDGARILGIKRHLKTAS